MLLLEDAGDPLERTGQLCPLPAFLERAIAIASAVAAMHCAGVLHKDIRPDTLLIDQFGTVRLTGFGIASTLPRVRIMTQGAEAIEGTLAYMAPEQTGRMNRSVDTRSDLYAVGVTLYEMLAGRLPFQATEPMEWVHCHIARRPPPLDGVPQQVVAIVMKLLEKPAESRYQSAAGLEADLRRCQAELKSTGRIGDFPLAADDAPGLLLVPERLYGRAAEVARLTDAFAALATSGGARIVLISGSSGIGKSSLVNELSPLLVPSHGILASGKFDQYRGDVPYATLGDAFRAVVRQILQTDPRTQACWRDELREGMGSDAALMVNLVPELEALLGPQSPVPDLPPYEAQRRFQRVFRSMLAVFAKANHPLVLFIDDVQWLDAATLSLLQALLDDLLPPYMMLVTAYRDNEVGPDHGLAGLFASINGAGVPVDTIQLGPLNIHDIASLVADTLKADPGSVAPLAEVVHGGTGGNPFFAAQMLDALHDKDLLWFEAGLWRWDLARIKGDAPTRNVVELMAGRLDRLGAKALEAVTVLACLGNSTLVSNVAIGLGKPLQETEGLLHEAVVAGLLDTVQDRCNFVHDSAHEAAYGRLLAAERPGAHLRIGRRLLDALAPDQLELAAFDVADQFNRGATLILCQAERDRVAAINLLAGSRARRATACRAALAYFEAGTRLLGIERWEQAYRLAFDLELHASECEFLTGDPALARSRLEGMAVHASSLRDRASIAFLQVTLWTALDRSDQAVSTGLALLRHAGIVWEPHPGPETPMLDYRRMLEGLEARSGASLLDLPRMSDPDWVAVMDVLAAMLPPAFFSDRDLAALVVCRMAILSLEHGNSNASPLAYAYLGMVLGPVFDNYPLGFRLAELGLGLVEQRGLRRYEPRVRMCFAYHVAPWTRHIRNTVPLLRRAFATAVQAGDLTYSGFSACCTVTSMIAAGESLADVQREAEAKLAFVQQAKFGLIVDIISAQLGVVRSLRGLTPDLCALFDTPEAEAAFLQHLQGDPSLEIALCWYWIRKLQAAVLGCDFPAVVEAVTAAEPLLWTTSGHFEIVEFHFHAALARAGLHAAGTEERSGHRAALAQHADQLRRWAVHGPANFKSRAALAAAVLAAADGEAFQAMQLFEEAIRAARDQGLTHIEAMAHEEAARLFESHGFGTIAETYFRNARDCYLRWGATAKVQQIEQRHRMAVSAPRPPEVEPHEISAETLDFASLVRTSQAVSGEVGLKQLIRTLMVVVLEHAGASRGLLVLPRSGELRIEAEAVTTDAGIEVRLDGTVATRADLPLSILRHTMMTRASTLLDDAKEPHEFQEDCLAASGARSVLCVPLLRQGKLTGLLYLENNLAPRVFTPTRLSVLQLLASQAAISLENATLEEKEALLKEVHHRVKNNLQMISSLLNLQAARIADPAVSALFTDSRDRVRSMAIVHENLLHAGDFARVQMREHLQQLCLQIERAYRPQGQTIDLAVGADDLEMDVDRAIACGLLVNELVSNAYKHAFPHARDGRIEVAFRAAGGPMDDLTASIELVVADDGVGMADGPVEIDAATSLGLQLVGDLAAQLQASLDVRVGPGTTFVVRFAAS